MKHSKVLLSAMMVFALCTAQAQNPWKKYGYTPPKALTLSDGKYEEFFNNDTVTQIGSVMFNTVTNEVVAFVDTKQDDNETTLRPEVISRFLSVDPLERKFPMLTPYQYASNSPIANIDIDGLEAWNITKKWSQSDINGYAAYAKTKIQEMAANKVADDCANFALRLIVGYASENGLPLNLTNAQGNAFDASSTSYTSTDQYLNDVRVNIRAKDLTLNTYNIDQSETKSGDLEILHYSINEGKKVNFNHVVIFLDFNKDKPLKSPIVWGNLNTADESGTPLTGSQSNWARSTTYNDGTKNKFSIFSGDQNSRWNMLNPSTMTTPEPTPAPTQAPSENCDDECLD